MSTTTTYCYCDPSVALIWEDKCNEGGCRGYAGFYFACFVLITLECARRLIILRDDRKSATFISLSLLFVGSFLTMLRNLLLIAKVTEIRSMGALLLYSYGGILSSFMWILIVWCDIIVQVNFSPFIQRFIPILRYFIIFCTFAFIVALTVGISIYWHYTLTNYWILVLVSLEAILFGSLGFLIWREYKKAVQVEDKEKDITPGSNKLPKETYEKVKKIVKLTIFSILSSLFVAVILWLRSFWSPSNNNENVLYLFIQRGSALIWVISILVCLTTPVNSSKESEKSQSSNTNITPQQEKSLAANWLTRMREMAFNKHILNVQTLSKDGGSKSFGKLDLSDDSDDEEKIKYQSSSISKSSNSNNNNNNRNISVNNHYSSNNSSNNSNYHSNEIQVVVSQMGTSHH